MAARRFATLVAALVAALLPATAAAGSGHATKVIVSLKSPAFHGKLSSSGAACASGRTVRLFREKSGPDQLLGSDRSNAGGEWSIPLGKRLTSGSYYAKAAAAGRCRAGKSKVLTIG